MCRKSSRKKLRGEEGPYHRDGGCEDSRMNHVNPQIRNHMPNRINKTKSPLELHNGVPKTKEVLKSNSEGGTIQRNGN